jgi:hypothetical protein
MRRVALVAVALVLAACGAAKPVVIEPSVAETSATTDAPESNLDLCVTLEVASLRRLLASSDTEAKWVAGVEEATLAPVRAEWACNWLEGSDRLTAVTRALAQVKPEHDAKLKEKL